MIISEIVSRKLDLLSIEIEIPLVADSMLSTLATRIQALIETARERRKK